jgi:hypothetical protein
VSVYRCLSTSILDGRLLGDNLPVVVSAASRTIGGVGQLDGYLPLDQASAAATNGWLRALIPDQAMLWLLQDGYPIWCGPVVDSDHESVDSHQYPITAYTPESIFQNRLISGALTYNSTDVFDIMRALFAYGVSAARGPNASLAGLVLGTRESGYLDTWTFGVSNSLTAGANVYTGTYADQQPVYDAATQLANAIPFEWTMEPRLMGTTLQISLRLGYPALGRYNSPAITLTYPGQVIDYARPVKRSQSANSTIVTASANGTAQTYVSQSPHGIDAFDLDQGYILRQTAVTWSGAGATSQAQTNAYADTLISKNTAGTMVPSIVLGGGTVPSLTEISLGDALRFAATSDLDPAVGTQPGLQIAARMTGWKLQPPASQQAEQLYISLGALVGSTGLGGVGIPA